MLELTENGKHLTAWKLGWMAFGAKIAFRALLWKGAFLYISSKCQNLRRKHIRRPSCVVFLKSSPKTRFLRIQLLKYRPH